MYVKKKKNALKTYKNLRQINAMTMKKAKDMRSALIHFPYLRGGLATRKAFLLRIAVKTPYPVPIIKANPAPT